jgi:maleate cis-trans isomerase
MPKRTRIGLIVPSSDATYEADFMMTRPSDVTLHSYRVPLPDEDSGEKGMDDMNAGIVDAARSLITAKVEGIAFGGTTASFYKGPGYDEELIKIIEETSGLPGVVTSYSVVQALRFFGAKKVSVATPYPEWNNKKLIAYLEALDFDVLNLEADPWAFRESGRLISDQDPEEILEFTSKACSPDADALFCSCTAWRVMEVVDELEKRIGKPVITSNQATIWMTYRKAGITEPVKGFGKLLESLTAAA